MIVTQFEMHTIEDLGLLKMDLLGLKNLTIIEDAVRLVTERVGKKIDISNLPENDPATYKLLQAADTTGVFQLESSGMRRYLKELKPTELEDITAMVALYRPGPMELIPQYISRKHKREPVTYLHPKVEPVFKNTYGIMIYQEQLMAAARALAGLSLAEADVLRKAVGKKIRKLLLEQREKLIGGCIKNGVSKQIAEQFWLLIEPFDRYGFNRSHAVCYATIAYQTAYLKAHYPIEFMTALLNADSGDIDRVAFVISECKRMNINVLPPDINKSSALFTPEENNIRFGLTAIKNLGTAIVEALIAERAAGGPFAGLPDILNRVRHKDLNKKSLDALVKSGALDSLGHERNQIVQNLDDILRFASIVKKERQSDQAYLFGKPPPPKTMKLKPVPPATMEEKLAWEKELLGLYISDHPLSSYRAKIETIKAKPIKDLLNSNDERSYHNIAGLIAKVNKILTKTGKPMLFAKIQDLNDTMEVVVFPETYNATMAVWNENTAVAVTGRLSLRNGEPKLICEKAVAL